MKKFINTLFLMCAMILGISFGMKSTVYATGEANPRLLVETYSVSDDEIAPGEEFELTMKIRNTSLFYDTYSVVVTLSCLEDDGMPLVYPVYGSSNQIYIERVYARNSWDITFRLKAKEKINVANIPVNVLITYNDNYFIEKQRNDTTINIPVKLSGDLKVENCSVPEEVTVGAKARISAKCQNIGMSKINNVVMNVKYGDEQTGSTNLYSIDGGSGTTAEIYINCIKNGELPVSVSFSYEDLEGMSYETEAMEYLINVKNNTGVDSEADIVIIGGGVSVITFILLGAIVLMLLLILIILKRRRR